MYERSVKVIKDLICSIIISGASPTHTQTKKHFSNQVYSPTDEFSCFQYSFDRLNKEDDSGSISQGSTILMFINIFPFS